MFIVLCKSRYRPFPKVCEKCQVTFVRDDDVAIVETLQPRTITKYHKVCYDSLESNPATESRETEAACILQRVDPGTGPEQVRGLTVHHGRKQKLHQPTQEPGGSRSVHRVLHSAKATP